MVHVIYRRENADHNISDAQIESQITILNDDFRGRSGGVDTEVEFCLAGIRRIRSRDNYQISLGTNDVAAKALSQAPPENFLNIWVVDEILRPNGGPALGFAQFPDMLVTSPQTDGIMVADHFFGNTGTAANTANYNLGRTATHEVGHWLNLFHTHSPPGCDDNITCQTTGDCCCDTPPQIQPSYECQVGLNSCNTDLPDLPDPVNNYLSYSYDACMNMFTNCQKGRINLCLDSVRQTAWNLAGGDCPPFRIAGQPNNPVELRIKVYPNPVDEKTVIRIELPEDARVSIALYDINGRVISSLLEQRSLNAGLYSYPFPNLLVNGQYFLKVQVDENIHVKTVRIL